MSNYNDINNISLDVSFGQLLKGDKGDKGDIGKQGPRGEAGPANTLNIGTVADGEQVAASITGDTPNQILNLTLRAGKSAYQLYVDGGGTLTQLQWLASLKAEFGGFLSATRGSDGKPSGVSEPDTTKIYLVDTDAEESETKTMWIYDNNTWVNMGIVDIKTTFKTNLNIDDVGIDNTLGNPTNSDVASAKAVMDLKSKLEGIDLTETKATVITEGVGLNVFNGQVYTKGSNPPTTTTSTSYKYIVIDVESYKRVRFLGRIGGTSSIDSGWAFYDSTNYNSEATTGADNGFLKDNTGTISYGTYDYDTSLPSGNGTKEYVVDVPNGAKYLKTCIKMGGITLDNFYCYLQNGNTVKDLIPVIANNFNGGVDKALSAEKGKELYEEFYTPEEHVSVTPTSMKNFIQSTNKWASDSYYRGAYIEVSPGDKIMLTTDGNNGYNALYGFLKSLRSGSSTTVDYASGYTTRKTLAPNKTVTITAPSDANYLYLHRILRYNNQSVIILPDVQKIISRKNKIDIINDEIDEVNNNITTIQSMLGKMSLTIPDGFRSAETVDKCQNTIFTPLHRLKATGTDSYFEEGVEYSGLPYYSTQSRNDSLYNFTLETIFSIWNNPDSILYTYPEIHSGSAYTGAVCSSVVCWFTGYPLWIPTADIVKMLDRKTINDISDVEIGDVLVCNETIRPGDMDHAMVVYDILFDMNGIKNIIVFEAWYSGTLTSRTYTFTPLGFMNLLNGTGRGSDLYIIGRLGNKIRTIQPLVVNTDIISERGDNTYYEQGEDIFVQSLQDTFTAISPSGNSVTVDFLSKPLKDGTNMRNIGDILNSEIGTWTLNGVENEKSHLKIIKKGSAILSTDGTNNNISTVTLSGYEGCKPCAYAVIGIRNSSGSYPSPVTDKTAGRMTAFSKANPKSWGTITPTGNTTVLNIDLTGHGSVYIGYYVRIFYETECGLAWQNTWDGVVDSGVGYIMFD